MKSIEAALLDLVSVCNGMRIAYAVMGGLAVRVHGIPRPTHDVDLTLSIDRVALGELLDQLEELGYSVPQPYKDGWLDEIAGMPLIKIRAYLDAGHGIDVDIFVAESEFQKSLMQRRMPVESEGRVISVVSAEDLILLKLIAHRPRDIADVGDILFTQGELDEEYLRQWATTLGVREQLEHVFTGDATDDAN